MTTTAEPLRHEPPSLPLFLVMGATFAFMPVAMDMYLPAIPMIGRQLAAPPEVLQLTLSAFFIGVAIGQFVWGPASDKFGRRTPLFIGITLYVAASIGCALAPNIETLIALRFLQALGAASAMVITRAMVFDMFDVREGARFTSRLMLIMGIAPILAPILGGWVLEHGGWRTIFYIVATFGLFALTAAYFQLPETRSDAARERSRGESLLQACMAVFRNGPLMRVTFVGALAGASFFTYLSNAPQLLIDGYGIPAEHFGYYFGVNAGVFIFGSQVNRFFLSRLHPGEVLDRSIIFAFCFSLVLLAGAFSGLFGMYGVLVPLFLVIGTFPFVMPNAGAAAQGEDLHRPGAVAAVSGAATFLTGAVLSAVSGLFVDGTARPVAVVIACGTGIALLLRWTGRAKTAKPTH